MVEQAYHKVLSDGEVKTCSQIWNQCGGVQLDYLAEKGIIGRAAQPTRIFKKSSVTVDEIAYFYVYKEVHP